MMKHEELECKMIYDSIEKQYSLLRLSSTHHAETKIKNEFLHIILCYQYGLTGEIN